MEKINELPLHRKIVLGAGVGLFVAYLLPWISVSAGVMRITANAWRGIGTLGGIVLIALLAWEGLRLSGNAPDINIKPDLLTAGLAGLTAVLTLVLFFDVLSAPGFGAFLGLVLLLGLGYGAFLSFQAAQSASGGADSSEPGGTST